MVHATPHKAIARNDQNDRSVVAVAEAARTVVISHKVKPRCAVKHGLKGAVSNLRTIARPASLAVKAVAVVGTAVSLAESLVVSLVEMADQSAPSALPDPTRVHPVNQECQA